MRKVESFSTILGETRIAVLIKLSVYDVFYCIISFSKRNQPYTTVPPSISSVHGRFIAARNCSSKLGREIASVGVIVAGHFESPIDRAEVHDTCGLSIQDHLQMCAERDTAATSRTV